MTDAERDLIDGLAPSSRKVVFRLARAFSQLEEAIPVGGGGGEPVQSSGTAPIGNLQAAAQLNAIERLANGAALTAEERLQIIEFGKLRFKAWLTRMVSDTHRATLGAVHGAAARVPEAETSMRGSRSRRKIEE